jgi:hypothetical protein
MFDQEHHHSHCLHLRGYQTVYSCAGPYCNDKCDSILMDQTGAEVTDPNDLNMITPQHRCGSCLH